MKNGYLLFATLSLILGSCGKSATLLSTDQVVSGIYTAVALTSEAQVQKSQPALTPDHNPATFASPTPTQPAPTIIETLASPSPLPTRTQVSSQIQSANEPARVDESICDNSAYVEDLTIPDGTILTPGETFVKTWAIRNTGSCTWKEGYSVTLHEGDSMAGGATELGKTIISGKEAKITVFLAAPDLEGTYKGTWIMVNKYGVPFGMPFYVQIIVKN